MGKLRDAPTGSQKPRAVRGKLRHSPHHVTGRVTASGDIPWVRVVFRHSNGVGGNSSGGTAAKGPSVPGTHQGQALLGFYGRYPPAPLPPRPLPWQRGGKAKVALVGWVCSPWSLPEIPVCLSHDLPPKQGWPVDTAGWPGTSSGSCPGSASPSTCGHLGGTSPLQRSPCWPGHCRCPLRCPALVMGCAAQDYPQRCPRGGGPPQPCLCTPSLFPACVLCVPGMTPICPLCVPWFRCPVS